VSATDEPADDPYRHETPAQRSDRLWNDMLQELRVVQTGTQLIAGFLLTLPFQQRFGSLSDGQRGFYLALVVLAALVTAGVMTPIAIHRRLSGRHVKMRVVAAGQVAMRVVLLLLGVLLTGTTTFVFDVVVSRGAAAAVGAVLLVLLAVLLVAIPRRLVD
jgi:hypothetical protein